MQNINLEDYKGVYVFAQQVDNELSGIAFELLGEAGRLAKPLNTEVTAVLLGICCLAMTPAKVKANAF